MDLYVQAWINFAKSLNEIPGKRVVVIDEKQHIDQLKSISSERTPTLKESLDDQHAQQAGSLGVYKWSYMPLLADERQAILERPSAL